MMALFLGAHRAWMHSVRARRAWWNGMDDGVIHAEIETRELRLHQRRRAAEASKYEAQVARHRAKRQRTAHLDAIALQQGTTRRGLLLDYPEATLTIPPDLARLAPPPPEQRWSGTLRPHPPRGRVSLNDDYVGAESGRRWHSRSLWRRRAAIVRHFGR